MTFRLLPCAALLALAGCDIDEAFADSQRFTEDFHHSYALKSGGRFELESFNGSVEIYGWDQDKVEINGTKYASTKDALNEIRIDISNTPDSVIIRTLRPDWDGNHRRGNRGVKYRIHVPKKVQFDRVATSNGSMRFEGVEGRGRFKTSNGPIHLISYQGDIDARTSNGRIDLDRFSGSAVLTTSNGPIDAKGVKGFLEASTSNGPIEIETNELDPSRPVKLETSNGPITVLIGGKGGPDVRARTSNGNISVRLPDGAGARVRAHTSNSSITTDFPLNNVMNMSKTHLDGTIGTGGPMLDLTTSNGHIRLSRK
jgi:hypothetical protein